MLIRLIRSTECCVRMTSAVRLEDENAAQYDMSPLLHGHYVFEFWCFVMQEESKVTFVERSIIRSKPLLAWQYDMFL